ncbi:DUF2769 domain-containing protein [Sporosarcina sp. Te-1]
MLFCSANSSSRARSMSPECICIKCGVSDRFISVSIAPER